MVASEALPFGLIKIEDGPEPEVVLSSIPSTLSPTNFAMLLDPKDPELFLRRCSGYNKKTRLRCCHLFGRKSQHDTNATFLPTCSSHRDQQSFAGRCQFEDSDGDRCGRLFRWNPPYPQFCDQHQGHPDTACHLLSLPLELRNEIYRYLLPTQPIGSSTAILHSSPDEWAPMVRGGSCTMDWTLVSPASRITSTLPAVSGCQALPIPHPFPRRPSNNAHRCRRLPPDLPIRGPLFESRSWFPVPLMDLLLVNRQVFGEVTDQLFRSATFKIDVRAHGTYVCGRRLLEPQRPDGSSHFSPDDVDSVKQKFLATFDWKSVRNYAVDILLEGAPSPMSRNTHWDGEVELYDIRDYVSVIVSGILAKCQNLCKLTVRVCFEGCDWNDDQILAGTKTLVAPFARLRNVRQPRLAGAFGSGGRYGRPMNGHIAGVLCVQRPEGRQLIDAPRLAICSVPKLPVHTPLLIPGMPLFDVYRKDWERSLSSVSSASIVQKPPIGKMFTEFKDFYMNLSSIVPEVRRGTGRHGFLHRARVAREQEDVESFRHLRNELIAYWQAYLELEERMKNGINMRLSRMLDTDIYPTHEQDPALQDKRRASSRSDIILPAPDTNTREQQDIPTTENPYLSTDTPVAREAHLIHLQMQAMLARQQPHVNLSLPAQVSKSTSVASANVLHGYESFDRDDRACRSQLMADKLNEVARSHLLQVPDQQVYSVMTYHMQNKQSEMQRRQRYQQDQMSSSKRKACSASDQTGVDDTSAQSDTLLRQGIGYIADVDTVLGQPGPSKKRCRTDSACDSVHQEKIVECDEVQEICRREYMGKGKGKQKAQTEAEVMYID